MLYDGKVISNKDALKHFRMNKDTLKKLGIKNYVAERKFKDINEIIKSDTGMVLGKAIESFQMNVNSGKPFNMNKGDVYAMTLNTFADLYKPKNKDKKKTRLVEPYKKSYSDVFKRYFNQNLDGKKLLVSRTGGLGDLTVSQSVLKYLKEKYPTCEITYATTPDFISLFHSFPEGLIDHTTTIPYKYDILINNDYHLLFIHAIENCIATQKQNYYDIYRDMAGLKYDTDKYISELIPNQNIISQLKVLNAVKPNTIGVHIQSTSLLRSMSPQKWIQIFNILLDKGYNVGIIDNQKQDENIEKFIHGCQLDSTRIYSLAKYSSNITHGINIWSLCKGTITIDSTFAHISGALKLPNVTICGPYPPYNVVGKYKFTKGLGIQDGWNACGKAPCFYNSQQHLCPYIVGNSPPECQNSIPNELIVSSLEEMIEKRKNSVD